MDQDHSVRVCSREDIISIAAQARRLLDTFILAISDHRDPKELRQFKGRATIKIESMSFLNSRQRAALLEKLKEEVGTDPVRFAETARVDNIISKLGFGSFQISEAEKIIVSKSETIRDTLKDLALCAV